MNTETENLAPETKAPSKPLGQLGISSLALVCLLVAAILNPNLWVQFGISLVLVLLTLGFVSRVKKVVSEPAESQDAQELIERAEQAISKKEALIIKVAKYWPLLVLALALLSAGIAASVSFKIDVVLSVFAGALLITNVQMLSLTIPIAISSALRAAADAEIFIRSRAAFEKLAKLNLVLFTKGGVLTESARGVNSVHLAANSSIGDESKLLALAASVESMSSHVYAKAINKSASNANLKITKPKDYKEYPGLGVEGNIASKQVLVGSTSLLIQRNIRMEVQELLFADESTKNGFSIVCVVVDGVLEGLLRFSDVVKPTSAQAVYLVAKERIRVGLATGDSAGTAQQKADELAISEVYAELSPSRKALFVEAEQAKGAKVGAIADPWNDSLMLEKADVSIALGESLELNSVQADVVVRSEDPALAAQVIALSARVRKRTNLGLGFGLVYGTLSIGAYVAIVSPLQVESPAAVAALLGSLSVLFVTLNAYSLGKLK